MLPAQNATGNWVKITQRVPVRIAIDSRSDRPLIAGLSARAGVRYLPTSDLSLVYQPDGLHPTAAGAARFGDAVADAVRTLG